MRSTRRFILAAGLALGTVATLLASNVPTSARRVHIDVEGTARPQGAGFDIGAYEWH